MTRGFLLSTLPDPPPPRYQIAGYTLHDTDNLDLRTVGAPAVVIQIQCGVIYIKSSDGKMINADEISTEAAGAARQLRAFSALELQAHYLEHASVATRKLAASNPLKALSAFFGGMAKSSANSELYGALAPTTGCKKPAAIISFARPTIPASSKWTVMNGKTKTVSTWYMKLGADDKTPTMRFEDKIGECIKSVVVGVQDKVATWTEFDEVLCTENEFKCPDQADIDAYVGKNNTVSCAEWKSNMTLFRSFNGGERTGCKVETDMEEVGEFKVSILDVKRDGTAVWGIGVWAMEVSATGVPTGIKGQGDKDAAFNTVLNVEASTDAKVFDMCTVVVDDAESTESTDFADDETSTGNTGSTGDRRLQIKRQLEWGVGSSSWILTGTQYCGKNSKTQEGGCAGSQEGAKYSLLRMADKKEGPFAQPGGKTLPYAARQSMKMWSDETYTDAACRMHDHGKKISYGHGAGNRLECAVDKSLMLASNGHNTVSVVHGKYGIAGTWGCYDKGPKKVRTKVYWRFMGSMRYYWALRDKVVETVRYGHCRYSGCKVLGIWTTKPPVSQPDNLIWGYHNVGQSPNGAVLGKKSGSGRKDRGNGKIDSWRSGTFNYNGAVLSDTLWGALHNGYKEPPTCKESLCVNLKPCPKSCTDGGWQTQPGNGVNNGGGACTCNPDLKDGNPTFGIKKVYSDLGMNKKGTVCPYTNELQGGNDNAAPRHSLQMCNGECDRDSDCAWGLKCFQRKESNPYEAIPGCIGKGKWGWDYCYRPPGYRGPNMDSWTGPNGRGR